MKKSSMVADLTIVWLIICAFAFLYGFGGIAVWGAVLGAIFGSLWHLILAGKESEKKIKELGKKNR